MTGIETDADPVGFFDPVDDRTDVLETAAHTVFLPGSVFQQEHDRIIGTR